MKTMVKYILQTVLGFRTYLFLFSRYKINGLRRDRKERDFFCFLDMLPPGGTVLDIGANIGIMTVHLASDPKRKVLAFEPMPVNIMVLKRIVNHYDLKNVKIMEYALGSDNGMVEMVMPKIGGAMMQGLSHVVHQSIKEHNEGEKVRVSLIRLDNLKEIKEAPLITGIKMDVENFESFVLKGALETIEKHKPLLYIELWDNENRVQCMSILKTLGYETFVIEAGKPEPFKKQVTQNFIFIHIDSNSNK